MRPTQSCYLQTLYSAVTQHPSVKLPLALSLVCCLSFYFYFSVVSFPSHVLLYTHFSLALLRLTHVWKLGSILSMFQLFSICSPSIVRFACILRHSAPFAPQLRVSLSLSRCPIYHQTIVLHCSSPVTYHRAIVPFLCSPFLLSSTLNRSIFLPLLLCYNKCVTQRPGQKPLVAEYHLPLRPL